jgi:uncharacterized Ntn-hydrolase superfamily protein
MEGTFSLIGRCERDDAMGIAVATAAFAVGKRVPHCRYGIGAIATQGRTDAGYGERGLAMLGLGLAPERLLPLLTADDAEANRRQIIMMDWSGRTAAHTGAHTDLERGHGTGRDCIAAGNTLRSAAVVTEMLKAFQERPEDVLAERLMASLQAAQAAGGDRRGATSAALVVVSALQLKERMGASIDLRVDDHAEPVGELARLLRGYVRWKEGYKRRLQAEGA